MEVKLTCCDLPHWTASKDIVCYSKTCSVAEAVVMQ